MKMIVVGLMAAGALAGVASATTAANPPGFARKVMVQLTIGSPEAAWKSLHLAQRRAVPQGQFAHCVRAKRAEGTLRTRVIVGGWRQVQIEQSEIPEHSGWSVRLVITHEGSGVKSRETRRVQVVRSGGTLRWLLDEPTYQAYRTAPSSMFCP